MSDWIICSYCDKSYDVKQAMKERPVPGHDEMAEVGLDCPHCHRWIHLYLTHPTLIKFKQETDRALALYHKTVGTKDLAGAEKALKAYQRKQKRYKAEYDRFHAEWRPKLGMVSPQEVKRNGTK